MMNGRASNLRSWFLASLAATGVFMTLGPAWAADTSAGDIAMLEQAVQKDPSNPVPHFELAMGLARTSHIEQGWKELKKVNAMDPTFVDQVIAQYEPLVQQNGSNIEARFRLAFGYYFKGVNDPAEQAADTQKARDQFKAILALDPHYVWAYNYLGYLDASSGDIPSAVGDWKTAIQEDPNNAVAHFLLGQAYYKQGQMGDAVTELATAMKLKSADALGIAPATQAP